MQRFTVRQLVAFAACAAAAAVVMGCSSSQNNSPTTQILGTASRAEDRGLSLTADPEQIVIDPADPNTPKDPNNGDKFYGESILTAVAKDADGNPQGDLAITFSASAGTLASNGQPVMTDAQGVATDTLRVYEDDPGSIDVSAGDGTRLAVVVVTKIVVEPPVANAGPDQTVECTGDSQAAVHLDGSASTDPNNDIVLYEWFEYYDAGNQVLLGTGVKLTTSVPLGAHTVTLRVTDATGKTATDDVVITVVDTQPAIVTLRMSPSELWPPNHKLVDVHATVRVDDCGPVTVTLVSVTSNEPENGQGDGNTVGDIQGAAIGSSDFDFALRAERSGGGSGRVYTIVYNVVDAQGVETTATATVRVRHDQSGH